MKRLICFIALIALFGAALNAQSLDFLQAFPQIVQFGPLARGSYLGVSLAEIDSKRAGELKLKEAAGVEITRVEEGSPADKAGLKPGDVVLEYSGQRVEGMEQFGRLVRETPPGREVRLLISRGGTTQAITAALAPRRARPFGGFGPGVDLPEFHMPDMPQIFTTLRSPLLGVEAESLGPQLAGYFGVKQGVLVRSVVKDTAADKAGIKAGDVITKLDGSAVNTPGELSNAVRVASAKRSFAVELVRDHKEMTINVNIEDGRSEGAIPRARMVGRSSQR